MESRRQEILAKVLGREEAPSMSPLAVRLVEMAADENAELSALARIISQDPGLATRILTLVNSPALRVSSGEVTSLERAVVILGLREIRLMALGMSLRDTLPLKKAGLDYSHFWRGSLYRAVLAREASSRLALPRQEEAFVAGLLLELGLPVLLVSVERTDLAGFPGVDAPLERQVEWERANLGVDHREVGSLLFSHWGLPSVFVESQQIVDENSPGDVPVLVEVVDFSRRAAESLFLPQVRFTAIHNLAQRRFGLDAEAVNEMLDHALNHVTRAAQLMDLRLDHQTDLLEVMEKANRALRKLGTRVEAPLKRMARGPAQPPESTRDRKLQEEAILNALQAVAHEIRNPLMSLGGFARRLASRHGQEDQAGRYAQVILDEAGRLNQVLSEMTSLAAPYHPQMETMEAGELVQALVKALPGHPPAHLEGPLPEIINHPPDDRISLKGDSEGLREALRGLVGYAAHLRQMAGGKGRLHIYLRPKTGLVLVSIFGHGNGNGGNKEDDPLAFKSFGPELGLARARRILEAHGGGVDIRKVPRSEGFLVSAKIPA